MAGVESLHWARLVGESRQWYVRFTEYRLMGNRRSVRGAYIEELKLSLPPGQSLNQDRENGIKAAPPAWYAAAKRFSWEDRAAAWDDHQFDLREEAKLKQIEDIDNRQANLGVSMQLQVAKKLQVMTPGELPVEQIVSFARAGTDIERRARGMAERVSENRAAGHDGKELPAPRAPVVNYNLNIFSVDELESLRALILRLEAGSNPPALGSGQSVGAEESQTLHPPDVGNNGSGLEVH